MRGLKTALGLNEQLEDAQTFRMEREAIESKRKSIEARCERKREQDDLVNRGTVFRANRQRKWAEPPRLMPNIRRSLEAGNWAGVGLRRRLAASMFP
jgi:hypothetical protein